MSKDTEGTGKKPITPNKQPSTNRKTPLRPGSNK